MTYREAESLRRLLEDVNAHAPNRNKRSDGWIGDAAHASRTSDHNPWVKDAKGVGVVRARDFTHDPAGGFDGERFAQHIASLLGNHPALTNGAYVIWNRRIISTARKSQGWRHYSGANPHTAHVHVSVGTSGYDSTAAWNWPPRLAPRPKKINKQKVRRILTKAAWTAKKGNRPGLARRIFRLRDKRTPKK